MPLDCSPGAYGGPTALPCESTVTDDTVGGNIVAKNPLTLYLTADTIKGSVKSTGGGPGTTLSPYVNFPIKENHIGGNLTIRGWKGSWLGVMRNIVGKSLKAGQQRQLLTPTAWRS